MIKIYFSLTNIFFIAIGLFISFEIFANDSLEVYDDRTYSSAIKTVLLNSEDTSLHYPLLILNQENRLELSFDDFSKGEVKYYYTFIHCNADWTHSSMSLEDLFESSVTDSADYIQDGISTGAEYKHFTLTISVKDRFKQSGNFLLCVYKDSVIPALAFTRRIRVLDEKAIVTGFAKQSRLAEFKKFKQEVEVLVSLKDSLIKNPLNEVVICVYQNGRKDNALNNIRPSTSIDQELYFNNSFENLFDGGNEFRSFSMKSINGKKDNRIGKIKFTDSVMYISIKPDLRRSSLKYDFLSADKNGRYNLFEEREVQIPLRYAWVNFTLNAGEKFDSGELYVSGDFCNWNFSKENKMQYDSLIKTYKSSIFLKSGRYDYQYVFLPDTTSVAETYMIEGDHFETENEYTVYVYYKPESATLHQLIGFSKFTSMLR